MLIESTHTNLSNKAVMGDVGIPSKAIWDPSISSASSLASTSDSDTSVGERLEGLGVLDDDPAEQSYLSSGSPPAAFASSLESLPFAAPSETDLRMKILEIDTTKEDGRDADDNRMASMMRKSINSAHGSDNASNATSHATAKSEQKNQIFGTDRDGRQKFVDSIGNLSDEQLRMLLWDSFRLARVILGKPIKDKRKLSHASILHSIRKVAELKIQNIRLLEEVDKYRQEKRRQNRQKKVNRREKPRQRSQSPEKQNERSQQVIGPPPEEDVPQQEPTPSGGSSSTSSSSKSSQMPSSDSLGTPPLYEFPARYPSPSDIIDESETPEKAVTNLREESIKILEAERDLATSQIQELEGHKKDAGPELFLSPSSSESDDGSYRSHGSLESPAEILKPFSQQPPEAPKPEELTAETREDLRVLLDELQQTDLLAASGMQKHMISLISRILGMEVEIPDKPTNAPPEAGAQGMSMPDTAANAPDIKAQRIPIPVMAANEPKVEAQPSPGVAPSNISGENRDEDEEENPEIASFRDQISAVRAREADSIEIVIHHKFQKEMLIEDVALAKKNTTKNREKLQLERLQQYKRELTDLLEQEKQRAEQVTSLDLELNELAKVCVKLEDKENEFQAKHERHQNALSDFRTITKIHSDQFRTLLGSIDRGIREQTVTIFGERAFADAENVPPPPPPPSDRDAGFPVDTTKERRIQHLEQLLTQQNVELLRYRAKFKARGGRPKKLTNMIKWSSNKSIEEAN